MKAATWLVLGLVWLIALAVVLVPALLIRPFVPQDPTDIAWSHTLRHVSPYVTLTCTIVLLGAAAIAWRGTRWLGRSSVLVLVVTAGATAWFARQNHFEWMFRPAWDARFVPVTQAKDLKDDEFVIGVSLADEALAFPVRRIGYHHLVNTSLGGEPIVATYCTLCHTGLVWNRSVDGRVLTFRLIGINNQNMMMEDLETRSWWQQVSGEALTGPMKGRRLEPLLHDEVTLGLWRREHPNGRVMALIDDDWQIRRGWEERIATRPTVVKVRQTEGLEPRTLIIGLVVGGRAKAYPQKHLPKSSALMDRIGPIAVAVLVGADGRSVRAFERLVDGRDVELVARPDSSPARYLDTETGSEWDISGKALSGPLSGRQLRRIPLQSDYWFDWSLYHPDTAVYREWQPRRAVAVHESR